MHHRGALLVEPEPLLLIEPVHSHDHAVHAVAQLDPCACGRILDRIRHGVERLAPDAVAADRHAQLDAAAE